MFLRRALVLLPLLLVSSCTAPTQTAAPVANSFNAPKDDLGRVIALKSPAKRVIVIGPGAVETVFALGAQKSLVGRDDYADFPIQAKKIAVAGDYKGPSVEKSVALRPDLVIVQGETYDRDRMESWQQQIGAPVASLAATDVGGVQRDIEKIGKWLGADARARQVTIAVRPPSLPPKYSAFIETQRSPLNTAGKKTLVSSVLEAGGFRNVAQISGYQPYGLESLLANQPDVYIVPSKAKREVVLRQLRDNEALSKLKCVREGQVVVIESDFILRPGPRLGIGIAKLRAEAARLTKVEGF